MSPAEIIKDYMVHALQDAQKMMRSRVLPETATFEVVSNWDSHRWKVHVTVEVDPL